MKYKYSHLAAIVATNDLVSEYVVYLTNKFVGRFDDEDDLIRILEREENRSESEIQSEIEDRNDSDSE